jgi:prepilin-type processing-associated H-X9-DG protein
MNNSGGFGFKTAIAIIAIIIVVAVIVIPVILPCGGTGRSPQSSCLSNMMQLVKGLKLYLDDNNGKFPVGGDLTSFQNGQNSSGWVGSEGFRREHGPYDYSNPKIPTWRVDPSKGSLWHYTNKNPKIFICSTDRHANDRNSTTLGPFGLSYGLNMTLAQSPAKSDGSIMRPGGVVMLGEQSNCAHLPYYRGDGGSAPAYDGVLRWTRQEPVEIHMGGGNFAFCDGHAKWFAAKQQVQLSYRLDGRIDPRQLSCPEWKTLRR